MTPDELASHLTLAGVKCKVRRVEVVVEECRFCGNTRWNLELNASRGVYHCWACKTGGRLDQLLADWTGLEVHLPPTLDRQPKAFRPVPGSQLSDRFASIPVSEAPSAVHYLARRGLSLEQARRYNLGVCTEPGHLLYGRIVIPMLDYWGQKTVGYVGRTYTHQHPKYLHDLHGQTVGWQVDRRGPVVVVEGAFDGMKVHLAGFSVLVMLGMETPHLQEWACRNTGREVVIMLDGEARDQSEQLYWKMLAVGKPTQQCVLPGRMDPAAYPPEVVQTLVQQTLAHDGRVLYFHHPI